MTGKGSYDLSAMQQDFEAVDLNDEDEEEYSDEFEDDEQYEYEKTTHSTPAENKGIVELYERVLAQP